MAKKLNRSKPFGEVCGGAGVKHKFEQDEALFDSQGEEVSADGKRISEVEKEAKAAAKDSTLDDSWVNAKKEAKAAFKNAPRDGGKPA